MKLNKLRFLSDQSGMTSLLILIGVLLVVGAIGTAGYLAIRQNQTSTQRSVGGDITNNSNTQPLSVAVLDRDQIDLGNIERSPSLKSKQQLADGNIQYLLASYLIERDNEIVVKDNKPIFKRVVYFTLSNSLPTFIEYTKKYGQPEEIITGHRYYGAHIESYLYPKQGVVVVGNADTNEVFETQTFEPSSLAEYQSKWGQDLTLSRAF